jgi:hypothetical protein
VPLPPAINLFEDEDTPYSYTVGVIPYPFVFALDCDLELLTVAADGAGLENMALVDVNLSEISIDAIGIMDNRLPAGPVGPAGPV